ncbi:hypothetical protein N7468_007861 [Penicillium chermesinum]|uniref:TauD/TfdA-like domain-containing protein n=1 Tax=Penicillium chermesinum TaxID=63820 RepID=A0A9W9NNN4_9EURO|nr:uncharacterized protein N7468_007861 [Penicillium chermesinum]KAJ5223319.1 hypothetical protein N7468_007861 [Penicillium chermesinum]
MSTTAVNPEPSWRVEPIVKTKDQKFNFGAYVSGLDLSEISDDDVLKLREAICRHKVIVSRQHPKLQTKGGILSKARDVYGIPGAENVRLIGKGYQGEDHYGLKNLNVRGLSNDFHDKPLNEDEFAQGITRFQRWHIDAPLYARDPAWFTTLRAIKVPTGPEVTIRWDDGSGLEMKCPPGLTAFFSTSQLYDMLNPEEQQLVDHSWVEYAPHPYLWIENCKSRPTGLGLLSQGKEHTMEEIGEYNEEDVKRYPCVWVNPVTGEKAFQVHGIAARKLFLRSSVDEKPRVIDDVVHIREFLHNIQSRILRPGFIWLPRWKKAILSCGTIMASSIPQSIIHLRNTVPGLCIKRTLAPVKDLLDLYRFLLLRENEQCP